MDTEMAETVYGSHEDSHVMSEKVQSLAASIYKEFERMIKSYDENVVKELMPLVVGILEALDQSYQEKQEVDVELELLRDDNEQLLTQYEREKQLRKASEQKYLEVEDAIEEEQKELQSKVESLESIVRMFELKAKNTQDHVSRLEDKEAEMKKEYNKLHERYTELFRTHMEYMERTKMMIGMDRLVESGSTPRQKGTFQLPNLRAVTPGGTGYIGDTPTRTGGSPTNYSIMSPGSVRSQDSNTSLRNELRDSEPPQGEVDANLNKTKSDTKTETAEKGQTTDSVQVTESSTATKVENETHHRDPHQNSDTETQKQQTQVHHHDTNTSSTSAKTENSVELANSAKTLEMSKFLQNGELDNKEKKEEMFIGSESHVFGSFEESIGTGILPPGMDMLRQQSITSPDLEFFDNTYANATNNATSQPVNISANSLSGRNNESSIFDELSADVIGEMDYGVDVTGSVVNPAEYASSEEFDKASEPDHDVDNSSTVSDNFFGMGKEVENLILENTELLATKNALNVVKDDLIAKVDELTSEQEILREEISSLQAVKGRLKTRVTELEDEMKKLREELDKKTTAGRDGNEAEEDVPMAQRKRFTRVEMARVLMERNQYKERLMELQEAVRWTEMIRASREHPDLAQSKQKKSSIWNLKEKPKSFTEGLRDSFSNLFNSSNKPNKNKPAAAATVRYNAPTTAVQPVGDPNKKQRDKYNLGDKAKAYEFMQTNDEVLNEKARKEREKERREQYKQVRAHVKKDDGRMQAYGWSLPAKFTPPAVKEPPSRSHVPVPVPVYCRPLLEKEPGMKVWCAAGVSLYGGKTRDGGSVVGASIFYSNPPDEGSKAVAKNEVERLDQELKSPDNPAELDSIYDKEHEEELKDMEKEKMSSLIWICTTTNEMSRVTVIDANNPADILDSFPVTSSHVLCIATVPGATESDYPVDTEIYKCELAAPPSPRKDSNNSSPSHASDSDQSGIGGISFVQCATGTASKSGSASGSPVGSPAKDLSLKAQEELATITKAVEGLTAATDDVAVTSGGPQCSLPYMKLTGNGDVPRVIKATGSPVSSGTSTPVPSVNEKRLMKEPTSLVKDGISAVPTEGDMVHEEADKMSSVRATMWMGSQSGGLYVHSAVSQWKRCLHSVKLKDSVLSIVHVKGRVMAALADGTVAVFHRAQDGLWDLLNYHLLDLGRPHHSIRCMCVVASKHVWCGYRNKIHVVDPKSLKIEKTFDAHPRKESQVRQMSWVGDGVWVSIRLDSTLRLYHAYTHQHLQDVDIEPYVSKMLGTGKLGFSFVRITALLVSCKRLWIGTGNGVIISVPLSEANKQAVSMGSTVTGSVGSKPGGVIRVYSDSKTDSVTPGSFIPYCSMAQAQLSFHGHRDAVKFFVAVPGTPVRGLSAASAAADPKSSGDDSKTPTYNNMLVMSGGEGYIDFRIGDGDDDDSTSSTEETGPNPMSKGDRSHLIVWNLQMK